MQATLRLLLCLVLSASLGFAAIPRQPIPPMVEKTDCCTKMKAESASRECERHAPKSDPDQQCCAACASSLAAVVGTVAPFVYPAVGNETFAAYISSERSRSHRPPVPPPRA